MTLRRTIGSALTVMLAAAVLVACAVPSPSPTPTPTRTPPAATGDGVLRIGTLFALTGDGAASGRALVAGVELAARELNDAGGVAGQPVLTYHRNVAGADAAAATAAFAQLVAKNVDVVIGPDSLDLVQAILPAAMEAKITLIVPTLSDPALSDLEDGGLLARTIPSAALQGASLAALAGDKRDVAFIGADDPASIAIEAQLSAMVAARGGDIVISESVPPATSDFRVLAGDVADAKPDTVVLSLPAGEATADLVAALGKAGVDGGDILLTTSALGDYSTLAPKGTFAGVRGVLAESQAGDSFTARLLEADPTISSPDRAAEAYDAVIAAAIAATLAGDESGVSIAFYLPQATGGGIPCGSWAECLDVRSNEPDIDYDGVSSALAIDENGDVAAASYRIVDFSGAGTYQLGETQQVTS